MKKMRFTLGKKIVVMILAMSVILCATALFVSYQTYQRRTMAFYEQLGHNVVATLASQLEAEDLDRRIIGLLLEGAAYERISEECFLTESAIKYRVKKMVKICHVKGRAELTGLLRRYLPPRSAGD